MSKLSAIGHTFDTACPGEEEFKPPVPSAVSDSENLVRFLRSNQYFMEGEQLVIDPLSFSMHDINGKIDGEAKRSVSTFRYDLIPADDLAARARKSTGDAKPTIALARALAVRCIIDENGRRDLCIFADSSDNDPELGRSPFHASIRACGRNP